MLCQGEVRSMHLADVISNQAQAVAVQQHGHTGSAASLCWIFPHEAL
jgi:hypothetical protein